MNSLEDKLKEWMISETSALCEGRMKKLPDLAALKRLTEGKNKNIWKYVIRHVKSKHSVEKVRKILQIRKTKNELHHNYPVSQRCENTALQQEIVKIEEKIHFSESSLQNLKKDIFLLQRKINTLNEENCLLNQKCCFSKLAIQNYRNKNELITEVFEQLSFYLNEVFLINRTKSFQCFNSLEIKQASQKHKSSSNSVDVKIKNIIYEMSSLIKNKLLCKTEEIPAVDLSVSSTIVTRHIFLADLLCILEQLCKESEETLKKIDFISIDQATLIQEKEQRLSDKYFQEMKLDHINSHFQTIKMTNSTLQFSKAEELLFNEKVYPNNSITEVKRDFILMRCQNEALSGSIQYLEEVLSQELDKRKNLIVINNTQKNKCSDLQNVIDNFDLTLDSVKELLNSHQTFAFVKKAFISTNEFIHCELFNQVSLQQKILSFNIINEMQSDDRMTLDVLKKILEDPLRNPIYRDFDLPDSISIFLRIEPFHNKILVCEKLIRKKKEMSVEMYNFKLDTENAVAEKFSEMKTIIQNMIEALKSAKHSVNETNENCKSLKTLLEDWWEQTAQFIPKINYDGKSLKMWLDILHILKDL